jgi:hypothetical protein
MILAIPLIWQFDQARRNRENSPSSDGLESSGISLQSCGKVPEQDDLTPGTGNLSNLRRPEGTAGHLLIRVLLSTCPPVEVDNR